jgi:hypothetical protein
VPEVIPTESDEVADNFTEDKILDTKAVFYGERNQRDPLLRWFFKDNVRHGEAVIDDFVNLKDKYIDESQYARIEKPTRLKKSSKSSLMQHIQEREHEGPTPEQKRGPLPEQIPTAQVEQMVRARFGSNENKNSVVSQGAQKNKTEET